MTSEQLNARLKRERASWLKKNGFESEEAFVAFKAAADQHAAAAEEARRQQLSREQQLQEDLAAERLQREEAQAESERARFERHVTSVCAELGVRNVDYALFEIGRATEAMIEGDELDVRAWLGERIDPAAEGHALMRAALVGVAPAGAPRPGVTTTPAGTPPAPPNPGAPGGGPKTAFELSADEWAQKRALYGI